MDVEPNGIVSRNLNTEFVNYYLSNLLIICNMLKIVICTPNRFILSIYFKAFIKQMLRNEKIVKLILQITYIKILTNKKIMRNKASHVFLINT